MNRNPEILEPAKGLSREIGFYVASLERSRESTAEIVSDMTREELSARISPSFHQVGGLILHIGECEFDWIETIAAGKEVTEEDRKFAHLYDTTENDFALKNYEAADCLKFLQRIHKRTFATLTGYTDGDLDMLIDFKNDPSEFSASLRWILHHLIDHESHHKGQISMIKRLIRDTGNNPSVY